MMMTIKNPYAWNVVNPELCYGRDELLGDLLSRLPGSPRSSFGIAGGRRMGKTTLLRRVEMELQASINQWRAGGLLVIPIYVDGLVLPRPLTSCDVWSYILFELKRSLSGQPLRFSSPVDFSTFKEEVGPVLANLPEYPRVVVLFDEVEPIVVCNWAKEFLGQWRALLSNTPGLSEYFTAVFAGAREMGELQRDVGSPLKDILEWRNLRALDYEDACRLMQEPIQAEWPETFLQNAYNESGGHPMLLQYLMQHICEQPSKSPEESLKQVTAKFAREHRWQFSEWWERFCTPTAQRVYARLPDNGSFLPLRTLTKEFGLIQANEALEILQHLGLVAADEDELAFRYSGEMFRRWYRVYGRLEESPMHDPELYNRLANIGDHVADKYLSAWRIYQQADLPNYSGAVAEMRDVLTLLLDVLAPEEEVSAEPNFRYEAGETKPTRRQRVRYAARQRYNNKARVNEITSDYELLETECERIAQAAVNVYRTSSGLTHTTATREMAYRALKQWESILVQLLPDAC